MSKKAKEIKRLKRKVKRRDRDIEELAAMVVRRENEAVNLAIKCDQLEHEKKRWICVDCNLLVPKASVVKDERQVFPNGECRRCGFGPVQFRIPGKAQPVAALRLPSQKGARIG